MPTLRLKYLAPICDIAGKWEEQASAPEGANLVDVVAERAATYGSAYRKLFFDAAGAFNPTFIILRNGQPMDEFYTPVAEGDLFTFVPPIAGG